MTQYDLGQVVGSDGEDGNGIKSIAKTGTSGLVDTYTITFDDDTTTTFQVTNGKDGSDASVTIVTSWNSTTSDSKVPSEKLAKTSLDGKLDNALSSTVVSIASNDDILITDYSDSNKIKRVANILATQVKDSNAHSNIGSSANATQGTINSNIDTALSNKANSSSLSTVATSGSYSDLSNKPSIPSSSSDLSDGSSLVKTSSTTGLLKNDGSVDTNSYLTTSSASSTYQTKLVSGTSIKTINNESLLGSGNISVGGGSSVDIVTAWESTPSDSKVASEKLTKDTLDTKIAKSSTSGLVKNDGTIDTSAYITSSAITGMLTTSDVVDNLTSTSSTAPLSAKQGKVLNDLIGQAITYINQ